MSKVRLALHGGLFSGKSTLAESLKEQGFHYISYTDMLKSFAVAALEAVGVEVTVEEIKDQKEKYRPFLIELGHLLDFDGGYGLDELGRLVDEHYPNEPVVLDNVRFPAQMDILAERGFRLVRLTLPWEKLIARADAAGLTEDEFIKRAADSSEQVLPPYPGEIKLVVDGPMDLVVAELHDKIAQAVRDDRRQTAA